MKHTKPLELPNLAMIAEQTKSVGPAMLFVINAMGIEKPADEREAKKFIDNFIDEMSRSAGVSMEIEGLTTAEMYKHVAGCFRFLAGKLDAIVAANPIPTDPQWRENLKAKARETEDESLKEVFGYILDSLQRR